MKQYQISERLFKDLCLYHLAEVRDEALEERIYRALSEKLRKAVAREDYRDSLLDRKNGPVTGP